MQKWDQMWLGPGQAADCSDRLSLHLCQRAEVFNRISTSRQLCGLSTADTCCRLWASGRAAGPQGLGPFSLGLCRWLSGRTGKSPASRAGPKEKAKEAQSLQVASLVLARIAGRNQKVVTAFSGLEEVTVTWLSLES